VQIFKDKNKVIDIAVKALALVVLALFLVHTGGLIARWYISGHAPWSDAYESMIYVAWATMFFGLAFGRKSLLTIAATAFVTSMLLMVAHLSWMDPAIANLQPVLDSYWLMIHVAVIVASYGPFTLGMVLGVTVMLLMIFTTEKNKHNMSLNIQELTVINEMSLTVGLVMLTIGNFLGGMWANESWGRYWGWDPKETWALISIMAYAFIIHMRLIPGLRGRFAFNFASIIGIAFIIFTYFGVNFYLSGLHSYQSGQQILSYQYIAGTLLAVAILGYFAYRKFLKFYKK
jgi:cytochrome c-type biogenesis protein CcsB